MAIKKPKRQFTLTSTESEYNPEAPNPKITAAAIPQGPHPAPPAIANTPKI